MNRRLHPLYTAIFLMLATLTVGAQDQVKLKFLSFPRTVNPQPVELLIGEDKTLAVEAPTNALSQSHVVPRLSTWAVGETVTNDEGESRFNLFGSAPSIQSDSQIILIIRNGASNSDGVEIIPIDDQPANFGGGKFLFMNATQTDIAGECGGVRFAIRPGERTIIKPEAGRDDRLFHAMFYFRKEDAPRPFFSSKWPISDKARALVFFYHDPNTKQIRLHSIRDFI